MRLATGSSLGLMVLQSGGPGPLRYPSGLAESGHLRLL